MSATARTVLVCPLDWGIGHATRCVPVIRRFLEEGYRVVIAADGRPLAFLKKEFPTLKYIRFPGTSILYPRGRSMTLKLLLQVPRFLQSIFREHRKLQGMITAEGASVVVSDNRYGLWSRKCKCILITHQLAPVLPSPLRWMERLATRISKYLVSRFDECWIPDFENHKGLAGRLSHPEHLPKNAHYIGTLSRFSMVTMADEPFEPAGHEILVLLSGPEPQRSILEEKILRQLRQTNLKTVIVQGLTERAASDFPDDNIRIYSHLVTPKLRNLLSEALVIICRSGYSSIMDVASMGKRAILIPTPGQPEQEYLARYLMDKKIYFSTSQEEFDLIFALELSKNFPGMVLGNDYSVLAERIRGLAP